MILNVKDFGAMGNGANLDTEAIQNAINSAKKGDTIHFSKGIYLTGTFSLKSDITLQIDPDAEISGSRNIEHYHDCGFYHNEMKQTVSLFYALDCENIKVTGGGRIQLSGDSFANFDVFCPDHLDIETMTKEHIEQTVVAMGKRLTQPIFFNNCKNIEFSNVKVFNSPCWTLVFSNCDGVKIDNIYVDNHRRIPNNDGVHCSASQNISVTNSTFLCGDDCFAGTCITNWDGVCKNILIENCLMYSRSAAIRFGHLSSKVENAVVRNIKVLPSNRAISIFSGDDGVVKNITLENIEATTYTHSGYWWGKGEGFVICADNSSGKIENITIKNSTFKQENASLVYAQNENVSDITIENCKFEHIEGCAHPYYKSIIDLQPNHPDLLEKPYKDYQDIYSKDVKNLKVI